MTLKSAIIFIASASAVLLLLIQVDRFFYNRALHVLLAAPDFEERYADPVLNWDGPSVQACENKSIFYVYHYTTCFHLLGFDKLPAEERGMEYVLAGPVPWFSVQRLVFGVGRKGGGEYFEIAAAKPLKYTNYEDWMNR